MVAAIPLVAIRNEPVNDDGRLARPFPPTITTPLLGRFALVILNCTVPAASSFFFASDSATLGSAGSPPQPATAVNAITVASADSRVPVDGLCTAPSLPRICQSRPGVVIMRSDRQIRPGRNDEGASGTKIA